MIWMISSKSGIWTLFFATLLMVMASGGIGTEKSISIKYFKYDRRAESMRLVE